MSNSGQTPSLEEVLDAFSVEPTPGRETLERYLRRFPLFAEPLIDLSRELHRELPTVMTTGTDKARIERAWQRHVAATPAAVDVFTALSTDQLRELAKAFDLPRQVFTGFKDKRIIASSVPRPFLRRLAAALSRTFEQVLQSLAPPTELNLARSYKAENKPTVGQPVSFEQVLIDAGVPEEKRTQLLAEAD
jgi:hypothetical protein